MNISELIVYSILVIHTKVLARINPLRAQQAKRLLFLTSIASRLSKEGIITKVDFKELNENMKLSKSPHCLNIGVTYANRIWRAEKDAVCGVKWHILSGPTDITGNEPTYMSISEIRQAQLDIRRKTPKWLRYESSVMDSDLTELFCTYERLA